MPHVVQRGFVLVFLALIGCGPANTGMDDDPETPDEGGQDNPDPIASGGTGGGSSLDAGAAKAGSGGQPKEAATSPPDASTFDASTGGSNASAQCTALFCEDFEGSPTIDTSVWTVRKDNSNSVALDSTLVAHGQRSVKFHAVANSRLAMMFAKLTPLATRQRLWGRAYFYVTPAPPEGHTAFITAGTMEGFSNSDDHQEIACYHGAWQLGFWGNGEIISAGGKIPLNRWACIEWEMNNAAGNMTVYVDGLKSHAGAGYGKNKIATGFTDVAFGFRSWHPANYVVDISMDDIAIDDERVGCLPR